MRAKCGGYIVEIVNATQPNRTLVFPLMQVEDLSPVMGPGGWFHLKENNTAHWVFNNFIKSLDDETPKIFQVGDIVRASQTGNHGFIGEVVSFEEDGGVVCKSLNQKTPNRCRFTYRPEELSALTRKELKTKERLKAQGAILAEDKEGQLYVVSFTD